MGCVDNAATQALLHERLSSYEIVVYVDAGNASVELPGARSLARRALADQGLRLEGTGPVRHPPRRRDGPPLPAEPMPDLIEDDGEPLPSEVPCGQVVVGNPQRHLTNLAATTVLTPFLTTLLSDGTLLHRMSPFCARRGYVKSYPALEVMDFVAA